MPLILRWPAAIPIGQVRDSPNSTLDWTATILDAAGTGSAEGYPLDGVSLLPWLVEGADHPDHDLFWRIASQGALRRGRFKYLRDGRRRARLGNWPPAFEKTQGYFDLLYDVTVDGREMAEISRHHPDVLADMKATWERFEAELLPYPKAHRNLPRHAGNGLPAVSEAD